MVCYSCTHRADDHSWLDDTKPACLIKGCVCNRYMKGALIPSRAIPEDFIVDNELLSLLFPGVKFSG